MTAPKSKTAQIRDAWAAGDKLAALRIASRFSDRSDDTKAIKRGWDAHQNPSFFRQIGKDPAELTGEALAIIERKLIAPAARKRRSSCTVAFVTTSPASIIFSISSRTSRGVLGAASS